MILFSIPNQTLYYIKTGSNGRELDKYMWVGLKEGTNIDNTFLFYCYATKNEPKSIYMCTVSDFCY